MFRKTKTLYRIFEHDDNQLNQQSYSRFVLGDTREACFFRDAFVQPLMFRKTKTLYRMFEHDDNQLNQQSYSRFFNMIQERLAGGRRPPLYSLSCLGKPRLFTECLNTMTTNSFNKVIRGFQDDTREVVYTIEELKWGLRPPRRNHRKNLSYLGNSRVYSKNL
jgi:hypothetical protein